MQNYNEVSRDDTIVQQPQPVMVLTVPVATRCSVPGLEYLASVDQLLVAQKVEFSLGEAKNRYKVKNALGQLVYYAREDSGWFERNINGKDREFLLKIVDNYQKEVLHMRRPYNCDDCACCCPEYASALEVTTPSGQSIGVVQSVPTLASREMVIKNSAGDIVGKVREDTPFSFGGDKEYNVFSANNEQIGKITKQWSGLGRELFTDADYFSVTFPLNLDVRMKALVFAALFLIDVVYYEQ